jgi:1-acyl-sn-glycerol-3-phosphate acyltransferase
MIKGKDIFGRIWALWGLIIFVPSLMVFVWPIVLSFIIPRPVGIYVFQYTARFWMAGFLYAISCPMRVVNKQFYKKGHQYVVTANHQSFLDVPLLTPFFPGPNKTIAKRSLARIPFFGWIYARGSVLVDRGSDASRKRSFDAMKRVLLEEKINMAVYPEGTRNRTGKPLKEFYDGAFRLAIDCQKDVLPVIIFNTAKALPPHRFFYLWPVPLQMHLLPPIPVKGKELGQLKEEVFAAMWQYIENQRANT